MPARSFRLARFILASAALALCADAARADEACQRAPEPVCLADWAITAFYAQRGRDVASPYHRVAIAVRLRLGRLEEARRLLGAPTEDSVDPRQAELLARLPADQRWHLLSGRVRAREIFRRAREQVDRLAGPPVERYLELAEHERRAGDADGARATLNYAAGRVRDELSRLDPHAAAGALAKLGLALLRADGADAARKAADDVEGLAPLDDRDLDRVERLMALFRSLRVHDDLAQLRAALGAGDALKARLAALAPKVADAVDPARDGPARLTVLALAQIAAAQANLGDRDAALATLAMAQETLRRMSRSQSERGGQALLPAHVALGAWEAAAKLVPAEPNQLRDPMLHYIAAAQARSGALREAIATILLMEPARQAQALAEAALAATEGR